MKQKHRTRWLWAGAFAGLVLLASSAVAMIKDISLADVIKQSELIVKGKVVATHSMWAGRHIYTYVTLQVDTKIKGALASNPMILEAEGGTVGDITESVSDVATFQRGEEVVLFLAGTPLRTVGGYQGKYTVLNGKVFVNNAQIKVDGFLQGIRTAVERPAAGLSFPDAGTLTVTGGGDTVAPDTPGGKKAVVEASSAGTAPVVVSSGLVPAGEVRKTPKPAQAAGPQTQALTAFIFDAWWKDAVDWDLDGYVRSTRLTWDADVAGGTGSIAVFAKVYWKLSSASTWNLFTTTAQYTITNTAANDTYQVGINSGSHNLYDWRIEIYRAGQTNYDGSRSATNDADLNDYRMETVAEDQPKATIYNAWWTLPVDMDADTYKRSARLNWDPDVAGSTAASLSVFEKVYYKQASATTWNLITQTSAHTITGNSTADARYLDLTATGHNAYDLKIEVYRSGATTADYARDPVNDADLNDYRMETAAEDATPGPPVISSISPGSASAGTNSQVVTISGTNFRDTQGTGRVDFFYKTGQPKIPAQIVFWSTTQIKCYVPIGTVNSYPGSAGSGPVTVTTSLGTSNGYNFKVTFGYGQRKWAGTNPVINYKINQNTADCTGEGAAVQAAANTWNAVGSKVHYTYAGAHSNTVTGQNGVNEILWGTASSAGVIATAWYWWNASNNLIECDIRFNDPNFVWNTATPVPATKMDVQTIALHELGHWLSLRDLYGDLGDNIYDRGKVMYGFCGNGINKRVLHADDRAGILWIYP